MNISLDGTLIIQIVQVMIGMYMVHSWYIAPVLSLLTEEDRVRAQVQEEIVRERCKREAEKLAYQQERIGWQERLKSGMPHESFLYPWAERGEQEPVHLTLSSREELAKKLATLIVEKVERS